MKKEGKLVLLRDVISKRIGPMCSAIATLNEYIKLTGQTVQTTQPPQTPQTTPHTEKKCACSDFDFKQFELKLQQYESHIGDLQKSIQNLTRTQGVMERQLQIFQTENQRLNEKFENFEATSGAENMRNVIPKQDSSRLGIGSKYEVSLVGNFVVEIAGFLDQMEHDEIHKMYMSIAGTYLPNRRMPGLEVLQHVTSRGICSEMAKYLNENYSHIKNLSAVLDKLCKMK